MPVARLEKIRIVPRIVRGWGSDKVNEVCGKKLQFGLVSLLSPTGVKCSNAIGVEHDPTKIFCADKLLGQSFVLVSDIFRYSLKTIKFRIS